MLSHQCCREHGGMKSSSRPPLSQLHRNTGHPDVLHFEPSPGDSPVLVYPGLQRLSQPTGSRFRAAEFTRNKSVKAQQEFGCRGNDHSTITTAAVIVTAVTIAWGDYECYG